MHCVTDTHHEHPLQQHFRYLFIWSYFIFIEFVKCVCPLQSADNKVLGIYGCWKLYGAKRQWIRENRLQYCQRFSVETFIYAKTIQSWYLNFEWTPQNYQFTAMVTATEMSYRMFNCFGYGIWSKIWNFSTHLLSDASTYRRDQHICIN